MISVFLLFSALGQTASAGLEKLDHEADERSPITLTVADTVGRVKAQNLELRIRDENVRRALERSYQRRAALLPQFGLRGEQSRTQLARQFGNQVTGIDPFNAFGARIEGSLRLIDAQRYADYRIAKLDHAIERLDYEVAVQDVLDQALFIYFTHLRDLRLVEILEGTLAREERLLDLARQQFEAGVAVNIDVTRAEVRVATAKRSVMEARTNADDSILQLKSLLDLNLDRELRLDRSITDGIQPPPGLKRYGEMVSLAEARSELQSQEEQLEQARLASRAVTWQRLPTIDLFADWGYDSGEAFDGESGEAWLVGIRATMPLWEGGRIAAEKREAKAAVRQNEYRARQLRNRIEREFEFARVDMDSRFEQIEFARDEVRLGMDEVKQARERYREGLADNRELIDAQQSLADAERSHLRSIYLYDLSRLAFARAIGAVERVLE